MYGNLLVSISPVVLDWIGYIASLVILVSLIMSSIKKLRWINLFGSILFGLYGFMIGSIPTAVMNFGIVIINTYYLSKIYLSKEYFKLLPIDEDSTYLQSFINFYESGISKVADLQNLNLETAKVKLYILRNMTPAGVFIAHKFDNKTLEITLDYAIPQYQDFKLANYLYEDNKSYFKELGYEALVTQTDDKKHVEYLEKMGFKKEKYNQKTYYRKSL